MSYRRCLLRCSAELHKLQSFENQLAKQDLIKENMQSVSGTFTAADASIFLEFSLCLHLAHLNNERYCPLTYLLIFEFNFSNYMHKISLICVLCLEGLKFLYIFVFVPNSNTKMKIAYISPNYFRTVLAELFFMFFFYPR